MVILLKNVDVVHVHFRRERSFLVLAMISYNHSLLLSMAGGEVIMHVEGCIVSSAVSVVHVDVYGE